MEFGVHEIAVSFQLFGSVSMVYISLGCWLRGGEIPLAPFMKGGTYYEYFGRFFAAAAGSE
jgi:hypothetical protein